MFVEIAGALELCAADAALKLLLLGVGGEVPVVLRIVPQLPATEVTCVRAATSPR